MAFKVNDLVWSKMRGYPPWPSIVMEPTPDIPPKPTGNPGEEYYWLFFLRSHNYAWIEQKHMKLYQPFRDQFASSHKTAYFKGAVVEMDLHVKMLENDPNYKVAIPQEFKSKKATTENKTSGESRRGSKKPILNTSVFNADVRFPINGNLILQMIRGVCVASIAEGLALAERCGLGQEQFLEIFTNSNLASPYMIRMGQVIVQKEFTNVEQSVEEIQKDLKQGLDLANTLQQPMLLGATVNEVLKQCCELGYGSHDAASVYLTSRRRSKN